MLAAYPSQQRSPALKTCPRARAFFVAAMLTTALSIASIAEARVVRIEITERTAPDPTISSPTRTYERIAGRAHG